jgi:hypothetical protein
MCHGEGKRKRTEQYYNIEIRAWNIILLLFYSVYVGPPLANYVFSLQKNLSILLGTVAIACLYHTYLSIAHYTPETWAYTKGALATVNHIIGFIGPHFFHKIIICHIVYYLLSRIPFYKAEVTFVIQPLLRTQYHEEKDQSVPSSLVRHSRTALMFQPRGTNRSPVCSTL